MAVFTTGMRCPICGREMSSTDELVMSPPFVPNRRDPLSFVSDGVFHRACFEGHPLSAEATRYANDAEAHGQPDRRRCVVCGRLITDPDDYFGAGYVTSDEASPAYVFNFVQLHRSHFADWDWAEDFRRAIGELQSSDNWDGPMIVFEPFPTWRRD